MFSFERRVLIVEDDAFLGTLMAGALRGEGFDAMHCSDALSANHVLKEFDPDIVISDIDLGEGISGIEFVHMVTRTRPEVACILLSKHADSQSAGFSPSDIPDSVAYLRKSLVTNTRALVDAIEEAARGHASLLRQDRASKGDLDRLTRVQREILSLMALGLTNQEIARRRNVSLSNVQHRVGEIFKALGIPQDGAVVPRVEAIRRYMLVSGVPLR